MFLVTQNYETCHKVGTDLFYVSAVIQFGPFVVVYILRKVWIFIDRMNLILKHEDCSYLVEYLYYLKDRGGF